MTPVLASPSCRRCVRPQDQRHVDAAWFAQWEEALGAVGPGISAPNAWSKIFPLVGMDMRRIAL
jgi:hypothetical protein